MSRPDLTTWALDLCDLVATRSRDPSTRVGAVILRPDKTVCSVGYNGFPRHARDDEALYQDRQAKLLRTVHAEVNAIVTAREPLHGYALYVSPLQPCCNCAAVIIQSGIAEVVARMPADFPERWADNFRQATKLLFEGRVIVRVVEGEGRSYYP